MALGAGASSAFKDVSPAGGPMLLPRVELWFSHPEHFPYAHGLINLPSQPAALEKGNWQTGGGSGSPTCDGNG